jgi:hypothetical protein|tara:strand:+ start:9044 stop:10657 length:1614 start_codon:yes stop_codon:yes gene_type:complete
MPAKYAKMLYNCHITDNGGIGKNNGYLKKNTSAEAGITFKSGCEYKKADGTTLNIVAGGGKVYKESGGVLTELISGLDSVAVVYFAVINDVLHFGNGVDLPRKYDMTSVDYIGLQATGTSAVTNGSATMTGTGTAYDTELAADGNIIIDGVFCTILTVDNATQVTLTANYSGDTGSGHTLYYKVPPKTSFFPHVHQNRMWWLERANTMKVTYSKLDTPDDYETASDAGYMDFKFILPRGDEALELATFMDLLIFFFKDHIPVYSGTNPNSNFNLEQLLSGIGVINTGTVQNLGSDIVFLYSSGVKSMKQVVTTGNLNTDDKSEDIDPVLRKQIDANTGNVYATAHYPARSWYMLLVNDVVWAFNYQKKAWGRIGGADISGLFHTQGGTVYFCGETFFYTYGTGFDYNGSSFYWRYETAWMAHPKGYLLFPKIAEISMEPGSNVGSGQYPITLELNYDLGAMQEFNQVFNSPIPPSLLDTAVEDIWENCFYLDSRDYSPTRLPLFGSGKAFLMAFSNDSADGPMEITDAVIQTVLGGL